ncbi:MAG: glycosyltransferase, partial [Gemmatimonadaceae bacterium]
MTPRLPSVLHVSTADVLGGAERIARLLHEAVLARGGDSWMAVGRVEGSVSRTFVVPNEPARSAWTRGWRAIAARLERGGRMGSVAARLARGPVGDPARWIATQMGHEDFRFPGTRTLLGLPPRPPDVLHLHNLHPQYFDLRELPRLSHRVPTVLTLHDQWIMTGHCAYSLDCERWETGCGPCPYLGTYPPLRRDGSRFNWERKVRLVRASRLHVAVPSDWLRGLVSRSRIAASLATVRVMRQGVDLGIFAPGDRRSARTAVGAPADLDAPVVLLLADALRDHSWKGGAWVRSALEQFAGTPLGQRTTFLAVGNPAGLARVTPVPVRFVGTVHDMPAMAECYRAADLFLHPSRADNYPNAIMEAIACGTPVVATAVGGTPEQVRTGDDATGLLVPSGDSAALAAAMERVLSFD